MNFVSQMGRPNTGDKRETKINVYIQLNKKNQLIHTSRKQLTPFHKLLTFGEVIFGCYLYILDLSLSLAIHSFF